MGLLGCHGGEVWEVVVVVKGEGRRGSSKTSRGSNLYCVLFVEFLSSTVAVSLGLVVVELLDAHDRIRSRGRVVVCCREPKGVCESQYNMREGKKSRGPGGGCGFFDETKRWAAMGDDRGAGACDRAT